MIGAEAALNDPEVKKHLLTILKSDLVPEQKYSALVEFFGLVRKIEAEVLSATSEGMISGAEQVAEAVSTAADESSRERRDAVLKLAEDSVWRAIGLIRRS